MLAETATGIVTAATIANGTQPAPPVRSPLADTPYPYPDGW